MDNCLEINQKKDAEYLRFIVMQNMIKCGASRSQVIEVAKKLLNNDHADYTDEELNKQVEKLSLHEEVLGDSEGKKSIRSEVERWIESNISNKQQHGSNIFLLRDCYNDLGFNSPDEKAICRVAFRRLCENGKIEKDPTRAGVYRSVNKNLETLDFINADTTPFHVRFPLGVHEYVMLYKKSLVVLAGEPNAGKTAFLLNTAWKNIDQSPHYFSSEMGAAELQIRLQKFPHPLREWQRVKFYAKASDFPKVIDPNGLNIIDYLEVSKDFYEIGGLLTDIFHALDKGVAVVGIQKPPGRDVGVGGARTLDKARLYMSIVPGELKIIKGKLWRNEHINPNGMFCNFKLGGGANFVREGDWKA